jgi:ABC-type antimicrobial peptide transport system permease subunit
LFTNLWDSTLAHFEHSSEAQSAALDSGEIDVQMPIRTDATGQSSQVQVAVQSSSVSSQYFQTLGITLLQGRTFSAGNSANGFDGNAEVVVSETLARELWHGQNAIGQHLYLADSNSPTVVVGVSRDVLRGTEQTPGPFLYTSLYSKPATELTLYIRSKLPKRDALDALQSALAEIDPQVVIENPEPLRARIEDGNAQAATLSALVAVFAAIALLLAFVGIYAMASFETAARRHSTAIRLALGETRTGVLISFTKQALRLCSGGLIAGMPVAFMLSSLFREWFWKVEETDGISIVCAVFLLLGVTLCASLFPAWCAARTDPARLLRSE